MALDIKPEDTKWYPKDSTGDFSFYKPQFKDEIAKWCRTSNRFESPELGRNSFANKLWDTTYSDNGYEEIGKILEGGSMGTYLGTKVNWIFVMALGFVSLVLAIIFSFGLSRRFRTKVAKCFSGRCGDRRRCPPSLVRKKWSGRLIPTMCLTILGLVTCCAVGFHFLIRFKKGVRTLSCDLWRSSQGHYFGAYSLDQEQMRELGVVADWKGTVVQHKDMLDMAKMVNASELSPLKKKILDAYEILADQLNEAAYVTNRRINHTLGVMKAMDRGVASVLTIKDVARYMENRGCKAGGPRTSCSVSLAANPFLNLASVRLGEYAEELLETTKEGLELFESNLDVYLAENSTMLLASYATAMTAMYSIVDVDVMMSKIIMFWDLFVAPKLYPAVTAVLVVTFIVGAVLILHSVLAGGVFIATLAKFSQEDVPSLRLAKLLSITFVAFLIVGSLSLVASGLLFLMGSIGGDACNLIERQFFTAGEWMSLPSILWNDTVTNRTNLPTVLDACLKKTGDGDVAAATGILIMLDRLTQGVTRTERELDDKLDEALDMVAKTEKTAVMSQIANDTGNFIVVHPNMKAQLAYPVKETLKRVFLPFDVEAPVKFLSVFPAFLPSGVGVLSLVSMLGTPGDLIVNGLGLTEAYATVNDFIKSKSQTDNHPGFCVETVSPEDSRVPCVTPGQVKFVVNDTTPIALSDIESDFNVTSEWSRDVFLRISYLMNIEKQRSSAVTYNKSFATALEPLKEACTACDSSGVPSDLTAKNNQAIYSMLSPELQAFSCRLCQRNDTNPPLMSELLDMYPQYMATRGKQIYDSFDLTNNRILAFVKNTTIAEFQKLLTDAYGHLEDFNCQFVGTSLQAGLQTGMCDVIFPSASAAGLFFMLMWIFCFSGAYAAWKTFHYLRDLHLEGENSILAEPREPVKMDTAASAERGLKHKTEDDPSLLFPPLPSTQPVAHSKNRSGTEQYALPANFQQDVAPDGKVPVSYPEEYSGAEQYALPNDFQRDVVPDGKPMSSLRSYSLSDTSFH